MAGWLARLPVRARLTAWYVVLLAVILAALGSFLLLRDAVTVRTVPWSPPFGLGSGS